MGKTARIQRRAGGLLSVCVFLPVTGGILMAERPRDYVRIGHVSVSTVVRIVLTDASSFRFSYQSKSFWGCTYRGEV